MEIRFCYRHPKSLARVRCFHCKRDVCSDCREMYGHHFFCGRWCYSKYLIWQFLDWSKARQFPLLWSWNLLLTVLVLFLLFRGSPPAKTISEAKPAKETAVSGRNSAGERNADVVVNPPVQTRGAVYPVQIASPEARFVHVWRNGKPLLAKIHYNQDVTKISIPLLSGKNRLAVDLLDSRNRVFRRLTYRVERISARLPGESSVERGNVRMPYIALTFDGGSTHSGTEQILKILRRKKLRTTLFLTGLFIKKNPDLVLEMIRDGHEIANHTYSHPHLTTFAENRRQDLAPGVNERFLKKQLLTTDSLFFALSGRHLAPYWRAPFGEFNRQILKWALSLGYRHVHWTRGFDTLDWVRDRKSPLYRSPEQIRSAILDRDQGHSRLNGAIILMHLGSSRQRNPVYSILPNLIDLLQQRGYRFVTISKLLKS